MENEFKEDLAEEFNYTSHNWVVKVQIGKPSQELTLEIDTTISATWVPSVECTNCISEEKYNSTASRTSTKTNDTLKVKDYLGNLEGNIVYDDFRINELDIELRNFPFIQAVRLADDYSDFPEGKLALSNINKYGDQFSFLNSLVNKGKISKKIFALEFDEIKSGKILFGDYPEKLKHLDIIGQNLGFCNSTTSEDLTDEFRDGWTCELTHVFFNDKNKIRNLTDSFELDNARAIFDSSYEFIGVSEDQYDLIYDNYIRENFKGMCRKHEKNDELYFICNLDKNKLDQAESLFIVLQGFVVELTAKDLFVELDKNHNYLFAIKFFKSEGNDAKIWILGHLFLKNFITVFDAEKDQVSFFSERVYDVTDDWIKWYNTDYYSLLLTRYFYLAIGACAAVALFLLFSCFLIIRSIRRKNLGHGPLIENEIK